MVSKKKKHKWPLPVRVEVEWDDSITCHGGWADKKAHEITEVGPLLTMGYLVRRTSELIEIAQSQSSVTQHFVDTMSIPIGAVRKIRRITGERLRGV